MGFAVLLLGLFVVVYGSIFLFCRRRFRRSLNLTATVQRAVFIAGILGAFVTLRKPEDRSWTNPVEVMIVSALSFIFPVLIAAVLERRRRRAAEKTTV